VITPWKAFEALRAVVRITLDPTNLDEVFVLADLSEESPQLEKILEEVKADPRFAAVMRERPRLGHVDQEALGELPDGTLGERYAAFMRVRGLRHENLQLVEGESDLSFLRNHMRETHDLWHVATGFHTDVAGELGLQAFYLAQFKGPLPVVLLAVGMINTYFRGMDDADRRLAAIVRGWLLGKRADDLFGLRWADHWATPLAELRERLGLDLDAVDAIVREADPEVALAVAA